MKLQKLAGATSEIWQVFIRDSSSTTGAGLTGLVFNSAGLTAYYHRDTDTTATAISLVTMTVGTFTSSGFKEIDSTNMPGWYQFCPPNAAIASGAKSVGIHLKGATNMAPLPIEVQLLAVNVDDAVRMGITALPNANAEAAGGLFTRGTGAGQINQDANGRIDAIGKAWAGGAIPAPNVTGVPLVDSKYLLGTIYSTPATAGVQDINVINWKGTAAPAMTGDAYARLGAPAGASVSADVAAVKVDTAAVKTKTDFLPSATAGAAGGVFIAGTNAATTVTTSFTTTFTGNLTGSVGSVSGAVGSVTGAVGSVTGNVGGNVTGSVGSVTGLTASNLDIAVSTRMATFSYTAPLDAAGTRSALGLASANLDTQIGTLATASALSTLNTTANSINAKTTNLPSDPADASDIAGAFSALQSHGDGAWATATGFSTLDATGVENAVWDATAASHITSGSFGGEVNDTASATGTIEGRIGTPNFGDLAGDIAHAQGGIDSIDGVTSTLVMTAGKLWVLDETGNPLPHASDISSIESAISALPAATDNAAAVLAATYEGAVTVQSHFRLARAALYGKANGLDGSTVHFRDLSDAKNRISATVDADGNRSSVAVDAS